MCDEYKEGYLKIVGLENSKRVYRYVPKTYPLPKKNDNLFKWKLFVTRNWGIGSYEDIPSNPIVAGPGELCTETFIEIGPFETRKETENLLQYVKTKFFRVLVAVRKQDQGASKAVYRYVPLQDFTDNSDIDWNVSISDIDKQLYKKYGLTREEIDFVETHVKEMA